MTQIILDFEPEAFSALRKSPDEFAREVKFAAVVQWYSQGKISQSKVSEMLNISRAAFLQELHQRSVAACQIGVDELDQEILLA